MGFRSYGDVVRASMERSKSMGLLVESELAIASFYAQSYLFVHFLHRGESQSWHCSSSALHPGSYPVLRL